MTGGFELEDAGVLGADGVARRERDLADADVAFDQLEPEPAAGGEGVGDVALDARFRSAAVEECRGATPFGILNS